METLLEKNAKVEIKITEIYKRNFNPSYILQCKNSLNQKAQVHVKSFVAANGKKYVFLHNEYYENESLFKELVVKALMLSWELGYEAAFTQSLFFIKEAMDFQKIRNDSLLPGEVEMFGYSLTWNGIRYFNSDEIELNLKIYSHANPK